MTCGSYSREEVLAVEAIIDTYCACLGARDGRCKHIVAAMYLLEDLLNSRGKDSVTSGPCQWNRKPKPDTTSCEVKRPLFRGHAR